MNDQWPAYYLLIRSQDNGIAHLIWLLFIMVLIIVS